MFPTRALFNIKPSLTQLIRTNIRNCEELLYHSPKYAETVQVLFQDGTKLRKTISRMETASKSSKKQNVAFEITKIIMMRQAELKAPQHLDMKIATRNDKTNITTTTTHVPQRGVEELSNLKMYQEVLLKDGFWKSEQERINAFLRYREEMQLSITNMEAVLYRRKKAKEQLLAEKEAEVGLKKENKRDKRGSFLLKTLRWEICMLQSKLLSSATDEDIVQEYGGKTRDDLEKRIVEVVEEEMKVWREQKMELKEKLTKEKGLVKSLRDKAKLEREEKAMLKLRKMQQKEKPIQIS